MGLVILVVFFFLRDLRTTFIPTVAVPVSLIGTFGAMYLLGFSIDNLSLMALTISTGFVVDDAIVVIENITRYLEQGMRPFAAALKGAQEIGPTVFTISVSLISVFIPLLLMGGIVGRLFREFSIDLSIAIAVSMVVSLTATPMMCAHMLRAHTEHGWLYRTSERGFNFIASLYGRTLGVVINHSFLTLIILMVTIALNVVPLHPRAQRLLPAAGQRPPQRQHSSRSGHVVRLDGRHAAPLHQHHCRRPCDRYRQCLHRRRARRRHQHRAHVHLAQAACASGRLAPTKSSTACGRSWRACPAVRHFSRLHRTSAWAAVRATRSINSRCAATTSTILNQYGPLMLEELRTIPTLADVNTDQQNRGLQTWVQYDRDTAARFGISSQLIDNTLYDAFGQRPVSTMYSSLNQYHVVMEAAPQYWQNPETLRQSLRALASGQ